MLLVEFVCVSGCDLRFRTLVWSVFGLLVGGRDLVGVVFMAFLLDLLLLALLFVVS